jgi:hypothetical protein
MFQRFPPAKFASRYPEIYPILNGRRYIPSDPKDQKWQPCFTEPKLVDAAEESALDYFRTDPNLHYISFSIQDSHFHCECKRCLAVVAKHGGDRVAAYSDMNAAFLNQVSARLAVSLPAHGIPANKIIVYIAYSDVRYVPTFPLRSNILPAVVFKISDILNDKVLDPGSNIVDEWAAAVKRIGQHDWGEGDGYFIPRYYTSLNSRLYRYIKKKGLILDYQHFEAYPNWGFDGPRLWITTKIWWNPDVDTDALLQQLTQDLFPVSHEPMSKYFQKMDALWIDLDGTAERKIRKWSNQFQLNERQRSEVQEGRRLLDQATSLARDPLEKRRVSLFSRCYRLSELFFEIANEPVIKMAQLDELRRYVREEIAPDRMTVYTAGDDKELMKQIESAISSITRGKSVNA